jgi:hypothetical protein
MTPHVSHDALDMVEYGDNRAVLILADSDAGAERQRAAAARAGCRVAGVAPLERGLARLDEQVAVDAVLVDCERDHGPALDRLLGRLLDGAKAGRHASVIAAPPILIDPVAALANHADVHHLCEESDADRAAAVARAAGRARTPRLHDIRRDPGPARLQQLSEEVGRIAGILARLSEDEQKLVQELPGETAEEGLDAPQVRALIRARRLRDHYFAADLFADPAWDMLLDLLAARLEKQRVAVSSLCIAAAVPPTTALRWIKTLTEHGLFERVADDQDGRRVFIQLSDRAAAGMGAYLRAARRISPLLV